MEVAGPGVPQPLPQRRLVPRARSTPCSPPARGSARARSSERIQVEFVSANPTGPLTAASGRHAAFGDALARILEFAGNTVEREYYFNDGGSQVLRLGQSILARARGEEPPEDGYQGEYVAELAAAIPGRRRRSRRRSSPGAASSALMAGIRATLDRFRVHFDPWFLEAHALRGRPERRGSVRASGSKREDRSYRSDGALWLRTTALGDDKDRVLERSTGEPTYFAADVAYHWDKLDRGFDRLVNVLGADHHGYVARLKAAVAAVGADPERLEIPILQFVHVVDGDTRASMSKRRGDFVTLDELIERSASTPRAGSCSRARPTRRSTSTCGWLASSRPRTPSTTSSTPTRGSPRCCARRATSASPPRSPRRRRGSALEPAERELVKKLLAFPAEVAEAADRRAPHRIAAYALETAQAFTAFYRDCHVVGAEPQALEDFRLALSVATQRVIAQALALLGVTGASDDVSRAAHVAASSGRAKWYPWPNPQPASAAKRSCSTVSIPSATTSMPRPAPMVAIARTIAPTAASPGTPRRNERSTLSTCTGSARRRDSEECSVPKSSSASLTPSRCSRPITLRLRSYSCIAARADLDQHPPRRGGRGAPSAAATRST